jgi:hypothetical protein
MKDNQKMEIKKISHKYNLSPGISASIILLSEAESSGLTYREFYERSGNLSMDYELRPSI